MVSASKSLVGAWVHQMSVSMQKKTTQVEFTRNPVAAMHLLFCSVSKTATATVNNYNFLYQTFKRKTTVSFSNSLNKSSTRFDVW